MICKDSVLKWFKGLSSHNRIDLMCSLLNKCLPFELRFLGTCLEDLGRQHFTQMKDFEVKANNASELDEFQVQCIIGDTLTRQKLALYVCLLHSLNTGGSTLIYKSLYGVDIDHVVATSKSDPKLLEELLTIYTVAVNHPAFSFEQRTNLGSILLRLRQAENRIEAEKLADGAVDCGPTAQLPNDVDGPRPVPVSSEIPPPNLQPGVNYHWMGGNFFQIPLYSPYPPPQQVLWCLNQLNAPLATESLPPAEPMGGSFTGSPLMSRHSSPCQSAPTSRSGSPIRKNYQPRIDATGPKPPLVSPPIPKKPFNDRNEILVKDGSRLDDEVLGLNERLGQLSTDEMLRCTVVNLNGDVRAPPPPPRQKPPASFEPEIGPTSSTVTFPSPVLPPSVPPGICRTVIPPVTPRYSQTGFCKNSGSGIDDGSRQSSSSSGSDASSTSHSPPITPANLPQLWDKPVLREGAEGEETTSVGITRPRVGMGRGRGRFNAVQTLPRERTIPGSSTRRDGPRSAPPTPHEDKKTYLMPPPGNDVAASCGATTVLSPAGLLSAVQASKPPAGHDLVGSGVPYTTPFLPPPYTGQPVFQPYPPFVRPPYSYPNGEVMYSYQPQAPMPFLASTNPIVTYSSTHPPPKIACYNCSSQTHHPNDCKEPTMEEYCSKGQYRIDYGKSNDLAGSDK